MSRRRNGTNHAAFILGLSMYGPMNTGKRKRPKGAATPVEGLNKNQLGTSVPENGGKINERNYN